MANKNMILKTDRFDDNRIFISLELLTQCNIRCSYCYIFQNSENKDILAANDFRDNIQHQKNLAILDALKSVKSKIHLFILGGEPTIYKKLEEIISKAYEIPDIIVEIITNGKKLEDLTFINRFNKYKDIKFTVSLHWEYLDDINYIKIFKNLDILQNDNFDRERFILYFLLPKNFEDFIKIQEKFDVIRVAQEIKKKNTVYLNIVDSFKEENLIENIKNYTEFFSENGCLSLFEYDFMTLLEKNKKFKINRHKFMKVMTEGKIKFTWCFFNNYLIDKNGFISSTDCALLENINANIFNMTSKEIQDFFIVNPVLCPFSKNKKCNCSIVPKRKIIIDEDCDNFLLS